MKTSVEGLIYRLGLGSKIWDLGLGLGMRAIYNDCI